MWLGEKSLVNSGVNEKSEWMKNNLVKYSIIWWIQVKWWIVQQINQKFKSNLNWPNDFNEKYTAKSLWKFISNHNISIQWSFISKWKINYFEPTFTCMEIPPFHEKLVRIWHLPIRDYFPLNLGKFVKLGRNIILKYYTCSGKVYDLSELFAMEKKKVQTIACITSVCLSTGGWACLVPCSFQAAWVCQEVHPLPRGYTHRTVQPQCWHLVVETEEGGTHPTGMLSCSCFAVLKLHHTFQKIHTVASESNCEI